jgi:hypothetical protein
MILGREEELASVTRFFAHPSEGPRALLLEGEAGIGKTTLWLETLRAARRNGRVLASRASEAEAKLSFTLLADLLHRVSDDVLGDLPPPQRRALHAALLIEEAVGGVRPDARAVSLGVLGALRSIAARGPITLAIDDIQWATRPQPGLSPSRSVASWTSR